MKEVKKIRLWTALITPLKEDLSVDFESLKLLAKEQEEAGNGILALGSTGEALNLDLRSRKEIIKYLSGLRLNVPIMAGIGGHNLSETKDWLLWLESMNVDAYLMVTPIYAKPGVHGQIQWFSSLMGLTERPVMLYNVPGRTGKELEPQAFKELAKLPNFWSLKDASGSIKKFQEYRSLAESAPLFCGDDALFPSFAKDNAFGLVSVASNVWPKETALYVKKALSGELAEEELWKTASESLFIASNPVPTKRLLKLKGRITTDQTMPPLSPKDLDNNDEILLNNEKIEGWAANEENQ